MCKVLNINICICKKNWAMFCRKNDNEWRIAASIQLKNAI